MQCIKETYSIGKKKDKEIALTNNLLWHSLRESNPQLALRSFEKFSKSY